TYNFTVTNADGQGVTAAVLTIDTAPPPTVTSASPARAARNDSNKVITLIGSDFQSGATVAFAASGITNVGAATFVSATTLQQTINVSATATLGAGDVTVTNPVGTVTTGTGTGIFTVTDAAPTVTS